MATPHYGASSSTAGLRTAMPPWTPWPETDVQKSATMAQKHPRDAGRRQAANPAPPSTRHRWQARALHVATLTSRPQRRCRFRQHFDDGPRWQTPRQTARPGACSASGRRRVLRRARAGAAWRARDPGGTAGHVRSAAAAPRRRERALLLVFRRRTDTVYGHGEIQAEGRHNPLQRADVPTLSGVVHLHVGAQRTPCGDTELGIG